MLEKEWLEAKISELTQAHNKEAQNLHEVKLSLLNSIVQLGVVKEVIKDTVDTATQTAQKLASTGQVQECVDLLVNTLNDIKEYAITQPVTITKEVEKVDIGISSLSERITELIGLQKSAIEKFSYYEDLEQRIKDGDVDDSAPVPGKRKKGRKPGSRPDKISDVRKVKAKLRKESKKDAPKDKES